jgi:hypothetical protein
MKTNKLNRMVDDYWLINKSFNIMRENIIDILFTISFYIYNISIKR